MTTHTGVKAQELMIGNYLQSKQTGEIYQADWLTIKQVSEVPNFPEAQPIPLTEQWLKEFGFVRLIQDTGYNDTNMVIYDPSEQSKYYNHVSNKLLIELKYVHQLQNLYWCLCGKQLIKSTQTT